MNKIEGAIELIKSGDSIYEDFLTNMDEIDFSMFSPDEVKRKTNQYATLYAQICEYYLKAMVLPNMSNPNYSANSDEELQFLANDFNNGIRKFKHLFKAVINSSELDSNIKHYITGYLFNNLPHIQEARDNYLKNVCERESMPDITQYSTLKMYVNPIGSSDNDVTVLLDLINGDNGYISSNSSAYPESRYAMISEYVADLKFLQVFTSALRGAVHLKFNNCISVSGCSRRIFPEANSYLDIEFESGSVEKMLVDGNGDVWLLDGEGRREDSIGYIWAFDRQTEKNSAVQRVSFSENGEEKYLVRDRKTGKYSFSLAPTNGANNLEITSSLR